MLWIARSGAQWRELPEVYGPWQSVYARFAKWQGKGTLERVFRALSSDADMENLILDSTCIKVHESANGGGKTTDKAIGRTRGGLNTKLHAIVDGLGTRLNPCCFRDGRRHSRCACIPSPIPEHGCVSLVKIGCAQSADL